MGRFSTFDKEIPHPCKKRKDGAPSPQWVGHPPVRALETNLLEETIAPLGEGTRIEFHMKPWEIKTLRLARVQ